MDQLTDVQKGLIGIGLVILLMLVFSAGSSLMSKEVDVEAHKRLVGKLAEDKANAEYARRKAGAASILVIGLIIGLVIYATAKEHDEPEPAAPLGVVEPP